MSDTESTAAASDGKSMNIKFPAEVKGDLERAAVGAGMSQSSYVVLAVCEKIKRDEQGDEPEAPAWYKQQQGRGGRPLKPGALGTIEDTGEANELLVRELFVRFSGYLQNQHHDPFGRELSRVVDHFIQGVNLPPRQGPRVQPMGAMQQPMMAPPQVQVAGGGWGQQNNGW